jgi:hypothetical protein
VFIRFKLHEVSISICVLEAITLSNKKPKIILFTWKKGVLLGAILLFGFALAICRDYLNKGYLETSDFTIKILLSTPLIVLIGIFIYWANRPNGE